MPRRALLARLGGLGAAALTRAAAAEPASSAAADEFTFFVVADPQVHVDKWGTAGTEAMIDIMNALPGKEFPLGGVVGEPRGVIVAGDLVDVADDPRHWEVYRRLFDPDGKARLRFRAFECMGNHDLTPASAEGFSPVQQAFVERNRRRRAAEPCHWDADAYHSSWDWGPLHFVNLNIFPGNEARPVYDRPAPWNNPRRSLDFLRRDLAEQVGTSGRPVTLVWHYGLRGWGLEKWWRPEDIAALHEVIAPYQIALILHGHEHAYARYEWEGIPVFMCPSPQRDRDPRTPEVASTPKGFLVVRLQGGELQVAHHEAAGWGETWRRRVRLPA